MRACGEESDHTDMSERHGESANLHEHSHFLGSLRSSSGGSASIRSRKLKKVSECHRPLARTCRGSVVAPGEGMELVYSSRRQTSAVFQGKHMLCERVLDGTGAVGTDI